MRMKMKTMTYRLLTDPTDSTKVVLVPSLGVGYRSLAHARRDNPGVVFTLVPRNRSLVGDRHGHKDSWR